MRVWTNDGDAGILAGISGADAEVITRVGYTRIVPVASLQIVPPDFADNLREVYEYAETYADENEAWHALQLLIGVLASIADQSKISDLPE